MVQREGALVSDEDPIAACAEIVLKGDPDRFLATMAAPLAARKHLFPVFAFNTEVARAPWASQEAMISEMRLQWWVDVLEEIATRAQVRRHPVATSLGDILDPADAKALSALVRARRWDIYNDPFEDDAHFSDYLDKTSGVLMEVAVGLTGDPKDRELARALGGVQGLANWFRAAAELETRGRIPFVDGRADTLAGLARGALEKLSELRQVSVARASLPALRTAWMCAPILKQVVNDPALVGQARLGLSEFSKKTRLLALGVTGRW